MLVCAVFVKADFDCFFVLFVCRQVLNIIEPPYSRDFVAVFLPLVQDQNVGGTLQTADGLDIVSAFLGTVLYSILWYYGHVLYIVVLWSCELCTVYCGTVVM